MDSSVEERSTGVCFDFLFRNVPQQPIDIDPSVLNNERSNPPGDLRRVINNTYDTTQYVWEDIILLILKYFLYREICCDGHKEKRNARKVSKLIKNGILQSDSKVASVMHIVNIFHFTHNNGVTIENVRFMFPNYRIFADQIYAPSLGVLNHLCYVTILKLLDLKPGDYFLCLGCGVGYLNTIAGFLIGSSGVNHGVEMNPGFVAYAEERQGALKMHSNALLFADYCEPQFVIGNSVQLEPPLLLYDAIYSGHVLPIDLENFFLLFAKPGGVFVYHNNENRLVVKERGWEEWSVPCKWADILVEESFPVVNNLNENEDDEDSTPVTTVSLPEKKFPTLQSLTRLAIISQLRKVAAEEPISLNKKNKMNSLKSSKNSNISMRTSGKIRKTEETEVTDQTIDLKHVSAIHAEHVDALDSFSKHEVNPLTFATKQEAVANMLMSDMTSEGKNKTERPALNCDEENIQNDSLNQDETEEGKLKTEMNQTSNKHKVGSILQDANNACFSTASNSSSIGAIKTAFHWCKRRVGLSQVGGRKCSNSGNSSGHESKSLEKRKKKSKKSLSWADHCAKLSSQSVKVKEKINVLPLPPELKLFLLYKSQFKEKNHCG